jgi:hypothetical protein
VAAVAVAALVVGLRRRVDESPAPTHADWTGENVVVDVPVAVPQSAVRRTVADAIAARRADTDPFPVVPHHVAVMDKGGQDADAVPESLAVAHRDEAVPAPSGRPPVPSSAAAAPPVQVHMAATPAPTGQSTDAESADAVRGTPTVGRAAANGSVAAESAAAVPSLPSASTVTGAAFAGAECVDADPGASPAQPSSASGSVASEAAAVDRRPSPAPHTANRFPAAKSAPNPMAVQARAAGLDSETMPAVAVPPTAPAPWDRAAMQAPPPGPGPVNTPDGTADAFDRAAPATGPDGAASAPSPGSPDHNGSALPTAGRPSPFGPSAAGLPNPLRPARHAASDPNPADPGSTGLDASDHPSPGAPEPTDPDAETAIPHQSSMAAGSSRNVGAAVAHVLAARAAAPTPETDRRGEARDRLLAALLDDPRSAVGAVVELQDCQERMNRIKGALHEERGRLRDVLGRLARSGLRADQLARLSGLADSDVADLLRRNAH